MKTEEYRNTMKHIMLSEERKEQVLHEALRVQNGNRRCYRVIRKKKMALAAAAAVVAVGVTAGAASTLISYWTGSSSAKPDYTSLPTEAQCEKDVGFVPVLLERFDNGYTFQEATVVDNRAKNDSGDTVKRFASLDMEYEKDGDIVTFSQGEHDLPMEIEGAVADTVEGVDIYYSSNTYCFVPEDYTLSAEEKQQEENGKLIFSYGADTVSKEQVQTVSWNVGDRHYSLMQMDGALSQRELVAMAKQALAS